LNKEEEGCSVWHYFNYGGEGEDKMLYGSEGFQAVPARPYDKSKLEIVLEIEGAGKWIV
jgi:hypothetical protein